MDSPGPRPSARRSNWRAELRVGLLPAGGSLNHRGWGGNGSRHVRIHSSGQRKSTGGFPSYVIAVAGTVFILLPVARDSCSYVITAAGTVFILLPVAKGS